MIFIALRISIRGVRLDFFLNPFPNTTTFPLSKKENILKALPSDSILIS